MLQAPNFGINGNIKTENINVKNEVYKTGYRRCSCTCTSKTVKIHHFVRLVMYQTIGDDEIMLIGDLNCRYAALRQLFVEGKQLTGGMRYAEPIDTVIIIIIIISLLKQLTNRSHKTQYNKIRKKIYKRKTKCQAMVHTCKSWFE